jgi:drug/metabolite transporter (DMT)-like permease
VPVSTKIALQEVSPFEISFYRAFFAYLFLAFLFLTTKKGSFLIPRRDSLRYIAGVSFLGIVLFWSLLNVGLIYTKVMNSTFLVASYPVWVPLFAPLFIGERTSAKEYLGAFLGIGGAYILISGGHLIPMLTRETILGDVISLLASFSFTAYILLQRKWGWKFSPEYSTANLMGFGLILHLLTTILVSSPLHLLHVSLKAFASVMWLAIGCSALPFLLLNRALKISSATVSAVPLIMSPLVGFLLCVFVLGEKLTFSGVLGGILIVWGIFLVGYRKGEKKLTKD